MSGWRSAGFSLVVVRFRAYDEPLLIPKTGFRQRMDRFGGLGCTATDSELEKMFVVSGFGGW